MNTIEPTDEQINRGIAEWMGVDPGATEMGFNGPYSLAPSYTTSHDACHQALERMTEEQLRDVATALYQQCIDGIEQCFGIERDHRTRLLLLRATAHQKALAIYKTLEATQ